jgi:hypothetical protein
MNATPTHHSVIIVGGGQAGLSLSYYLKQRGIDHLVIEKHDPVHAWRDQRWDSFCLVTPNWQCKLPDWEYSGPDPHGFMRKDEIIDYLDGFVRHLYGLLSGLDGDVLRFAPDLAANLAHADRIYNGINASIDKYIAQQGIDAPPPALYTPVWEVPQERERLSLREAGITSVIWCIGFQPDFSWLEAPVFNGRGHPGHVRGITAQPGLCFLGLPWLHTWGSGRFSGVARDAAHIAEAIAQRLDSPSSPAQRSDQAAVAVA